MNAPRKNSAVKTYGHLKIEDEIRDALAKDPKNYTADEADEIVDAILNAPEQEIILPPKAIEGTNNKKFEEWKVRAIYKDVENAMGKVIGRKFEKFEKDAQKPIRTTFITEDKAELLNSQAENTLLYLFEV